MITNLTKSLAAVALLGSLAACQTMDTTADETPITMRVANPHGIESTKHMLWNNQGSMKPSEGNIALSNTGTLRKAILAYGGITNPGGNLGSLINQVEAANLASGGNVPGLTGLGGIVGHGFLKLAKEATLGNGNYNHGARVVTSVSGQIIDYEFIQQPGLDVGEGMIEAITYVTHSLVTPSGQVPQSETVAYKFKVSVGSGGFTVIRHSGNDSNPFPIPAGSSTSIGFLPETLTRIKSLGFQYKLWAAGTTIQVTEFAVDEDYDWNGPPVFETINSSHADWEKYRRLFETDDKSCIDMMFVDYPPRELNDLSPPFYCLGRCENPLLINTR